jgi:hypothetical protein
MRCQIAVHVGSAIKNPATIPDEVWTDARLALSILLPLTASAVSSAFLRSKKFRVHLRLLAAQCGVWRKSASEVDWLNVGVKQFV